MLWDWWVGVGLVGWVRDGWCGVVRLLYKHKSYNINLEIERNK